MVVRGRSSRKYKRRPQSDSDATERARRPEVKDKRHQNWMDYLDDAEEDIEESSDEDAEGDEEESKEKAD